MKISITSTKLQKVYVVPPDVYFVGVTLIYKDMNIEIINNYSSKKHEEIILDENAKLILHYYSTSGAKEILESFEGYEGIRCIEIHNPLLDLIVSI